ncbi:MAG: hypothetical protein WCE52_07310 [Candidatus Acidiferrum sp.]
MMAEEFRSKVQKTRGATSGKRIVLHGHAPPETGTAEASLKAACEGSQRVFLISPANAAGTRAKRLLDGTSPSDLARRLNATGAPLDEVFTYMSSLYFRGKLMYARRFSNPPPGLPGILIITPSRGLLRPEELVTRAEMAEISYIRALHNNPAFRDPLDRDARLLSEKLQPGAEVVLLGSIATLKYVEPLVAILGGRLVFPHDFVGRGNMSRGGLLLQCCRENRELRYSRVMNAVLHEKRPAKPRTAKLPSGE